MKGLIYKITSNSTDRIYIGSTENTLEKRLSQHKSKYNIYLSGRGKYLSSYEILRLGDYDIELIEEYEFETKKDLLKREGFYIKQNIDITVNKVIPTRTKSEYYRDNRERIRNWADARLICDCGKSYTRNNYSHHIKSQFHRNNIIV